MAKIFLSYRRQDSAAMTGRISDRLRAHFGSDAVFMDIDNIPFGVNFRKHIDAAVRQCDVFLAVIGTKWAGESDTHRRLNDPGDVVRIELESALRRDIPVIPVLIDHAKMPCEADLSPSLAVLADFNALDVDHGRDFHHHVDLLIKGIELHFQAFSAAAAGPSRETTISTTESSSSSPSSPREQLTNSLGMTLVEVKRGSFIVGCSEDQVGNHVRVVPECERGRFESEQPKNMVKIARAFYLGINQVTQHQFRLVTGNCPSHFTGSDDLPVDSVSWLDAVDFCNKLSELDKRTPFYRIDGNDVTVISGNGYRFPTEAEWEFACRANTTTPYPFGDNEGTLGDHAWYANNSENKTHPVGRKLPNAWGLYDMLGNVWEWVR